MTESGITTPLKQPPSQTVNGSVCLDFETDSSNRTCVRNCFRTGLFHLSKPYWDGDQLVAQLVNPTAGLFESDRMESRITVGRDARACVLSPSSTHVYSMPEGGTAASTQVFHIAEGGSFAYLPKWLVMHKGSRFQQSTLIDLEAGTSLFFLDLLSAGRSLSGEFLEFDQLCSSTEVRLQGRLLLKDRLECGNAKNRWVWKAGGEDFGYLANVYVYFDGAAQFCEKTLPGAFQKVDLAMPAGFTCISPDFVILRILGKSSLEVSRLLKALGQLLQDRVPVSSICRRIG